MRADPDRKVPARSETAMAATSHPAGVAAAVEVLKAGGNAVDAAIAMNAVMGVVEPTGCGLGGDLYALVWDRSESKLYGLNASGRSPAAASLDTLVKLGYSEMPARGPLSLSVPGCVSGWQALHARFGTRPWADLLLPAVAASQEGVAVPPVIARSWAASRDVLESAALGPETYLPGGRPPQAGDVFRNPKLASTLDEIARNGAEAFYHGRIPAAIADHVAALGGLLSASDFESHRADWVEPIGIGYRGRTVWQIPPPGQGLTVLSMLAILDGFDLGSLSPVDRWHLMLEAKKLAYADRAAWIADPDFAPDRSQELLEPDRIRRRRESIDLERAMDLPAPTDVGHPDTVTMTVVDRHRNAVSLIQSNYMGFGSGVMAADLGFMIQNRGCSFSLDPRHPNRLEPRKRPFHTIIPGFVTRRGQAEFCFGVMGGDYQPQGQVAVLVGILDAGLDPQAAGDALRLEHVGSPQPTGRYGDVPPGKGAVFAEPGFPADWQAALETKGHVFGAPAVNGGGYQGIWIEPDGTLVGASECRKDGLADGF